VLVTIHVSLRQAIEQVTFDAVLETLRITHRSAQLWGQPHARIGVAGLNPHAGEGGLFGDEEIQHIAPAIEQARSLGIHATGPFAPDTIFMRARHAPPQHPGEFDAVVAMTHDQGLIPVKYLGVEDGVNVTLGLPLVRTSPDHGTVVDIARAQGLIPVKYLGVEDGVNVTLGLPLVRHQSRSRHGVRHRAAGACRRGQSGRGDCIGGEVGGP